MADVNVSIGATLDDLRDGISQAASAVEGLASKFTSLGNLIGISLSAVGIEQFVTRMADLGSQAETTAAALGISIQSVVELQGIARLTGTSMEALTVGIERMSLNVQRSTRDAFNPQAQALKILGLSAKELIGLNADQYFEKLATAASKFAPSLNLTNALMEIGGRNATQLVGVLQSAGAHYAEFRTQIIAASGGMTEAIPKMADTHLKLAIMETAVQSLGARIFTVLKPAIDAVVTSITKWAEKLDIGLLREYALQLTDALADGAVQAAVAFAGLSSSLDEVITKLKTIMTGAAIGAGIGLIAGGGPIGAALLGVAGGSLGAAIANFRADTDRASGEVGSAGTKIAQSIREAQAKIKASLLPSYTTKDILTALGGGQPGGKQAGAIAQDLQSQMRDAIKVADEAYKELEAKATAAVEAFRITEFQKYEILKQALADREAAEIAAGEKFKVAHAKFLADYAKVDQQETKSIVDTWKKAGDDIASAFNSQLRGLLAGTTSWGQAMKNMFGDLILSIIQGFVKMAAEWAAAQIAMTVSGTTTLGAKVAQFVSQLQADAALTFGGVFANLAPALGPAAVGPAAAAQGLVLAQLGNVPKYAVGIDYVPRDQLAFLHEGERVVPAAQNTNNFNGGGLNITAVDANSLARFLRRNPNVLDSIFGKMSQRSALATLMR